MTKAMRRDQLDRYNTYLARFAAPGHTPVPGRAGPRVRHPYLRGLVRIEYHPRWIVENAPSIYASIDARVAGYGLAASSGHATDSEQINASLERLSRQRQALDQFLATGRMPHHGIRVTNAN